MLPGVTQAIVSVVNWLVIRTPLDIASHAWNLCVGDGVTREYRIDCSLQVGTVDGLLVAWSRAVVLASIYQSMRRIEEEKIGCAGSLVSSGDLLGFVVQIGEFKPVVAGQFGHFQRAVLRIAGHVVRADHDHCQTPPARYVGKAHERIDNVQHIGAVIAGKYHQ